MGSLKPVIGVLRTLVPIFYCGGLVYYFIGYSGSLQGAKDIGLGPTLLGLSLIGGGFCVVLVVKFLLIFLSLRSPKSGGRPPSGGMPPDDGDEAFDADAVIARYRARQARTIMVPAGHSPPSRPQPLATPRGDSRPRGFGRRNR